MKRPVHNIKIDENHLRDVNSGEKTFEVRCDDREYEVDDIVIMHGFDRSASTPDDLRYSGRIAVTQITYVTKYMQKKGFVVFGFKKADFK